MAQPKAPYVKGSSTSKAAAHAIEPHLGRLERLVMDAIEAAGANGLTDKEMERQLNLEHETGSPRRCRLVDLGLVVDSGMTRPSERGNPSKVWVASGTSGINPPKKPPKPTPKQALVAIGEIERVFTEHAKRTGEKPSAELIKLRHWVKYYVGKVR